jgi:hypothetical protein
MVINDQRQERWIATSNTPPGSDTRSLPRFINGTQRKTKKLKATVIEYEKAFVNTCCL